MGEPISVETFVKWLCDDCGRATTEPDTRLVPIGQRAVCPHCQSENIGAVVPHALLDAACAELARLREELERVTIERDNLRNSFLEPKQVLHSRLAEERAAREKAEAELHVEAKRANEAGTYAASQYARAEKAEARLRELESDERLQLATTAITLSSTRDPMMLARVVRDALLEGDQSAELRSRGRT